MTTSVQKTIRIHINTDDQPRPVVFNYRQLYKKELKKHEAPDVDTPPVLETNNDDFYNQLLQKNTDSYAIDEDDDGNDQEDDDEDEENTALESKKQISDEYDFADPFIDDSEMLMDKSVEYSLPEFDGFFVYHGPLDGHESEEKKAAPKRKAPAKPKASSSTTTTKKSTTIQNTDKSRKKASDDSPKTVSVSTPTISTSTSTTVPTTATTTATATTATTTATTTASASAKKSTTIKSTTSVKKPTTSSTSKKKKKVEEETEDSIAKKKAIPQVLKPLDPEINVLLDKLRHDVKLESFENKSKFPVSLKPTVLEIGLLTFRKYKTIDDNLVYHLMTILPYNRFTLKKFLTTKSGQMRVDELQQEIDELAILLKQTIDKMMPEQRRLYNEKLAQAQNNTSTEEEDGVPVPRFRCNDDVRKLLYDIIQSEEQSIQIANQIILHKDTEAKPEGLSSDGKARKLMYQRLLSCWPEGWMFSYEMSKQYSQYKSKVALSSEKKTNNIPTTPKANIVTADVKKRKRVQEDPQPLQKKPHIGNVDKPVDVITIDTDDENDNDASSSKPWNKSNSMKIESLISGPK